MRCLPLSGVWSHLVSGARLTLHNFTIFYFFAFFGFPRRLQRRGGRSLDHSIFRSRPELRARARSGSLYRTHVLRRGLPRMTFQCSRVLYVMHRSNMPRFGRGVSPLCTIHSTIHQRTTAWYLPRIVRLSRTTWALGDALIRCGACGGLQPLRERRRRWRSGRTAPQPPLALRALRA